MWKETLPENCPPPAATEINQEVYRILQFEDSSEDDFIPYAKLRPNNKRYNNTLCLAYAISFFDTIDNAKAAYINSLLRGRKLGDYIGKFSLLNTDGKSTYNSTNGHISTWLYNSWELKNFKCLNVTSINEN
jgi:hypothetical protein